MSGCGFQGLVAAGVREAYGIAFSMRSFIALLSLCFAAVAAASSVDEDSSKEIHNTAVVESGSYLVTAKRVDPEEKEIYVTMEDGRILELYFSEATKLKRGGQDVAFEELKNGQRLKVQVEKDGGNVKPVVVFILD